MTALHHTFCFFQDNAGNFHMSLCLLIKSR